VVARERGRQSGWEWSAAAPQPMLLGMKRLFAAYRERVRGRPDSEHSQALLRVGIVGLLLIYTSWVVRQDPSGGARLWAINIFSAGFSVVLLACILRHPAASPLRRGIGAVHDNSAVTVWLFHAGPLGALYLFVYLFVTVGNGFRFGVKYLAWSGFLGAVGIGALVVAAPAWQSYQMIGIGVFLSHVLVTVYVGVLLRRLQQVQNQLQELATCDGLTGLPNRRLFMDRLAHVLLGRGCRNVACLYLDLDGFKTVNDGYGHDVGDQLLKAVADRIRGCIRLSDVPARLGGDEFAVLLDELTGPDDARQVAERIINAIKGVTDVDGRVVTVGASVGIAYLAGGGVKAAPVAAALVRSADDAMYRAKNSGKGQYRFVDAAPGPMASAIESGGVGVSYSGSSSVRQSG
jgi:diguanylate cyclase (GGDEF)-like protein